MTIILTLPPSQTIPGSTTPFMLTQSQARLLFYCLPGDGLLLIRQLRVKKAKEDRIDSDIENVKQE